MIALLVIIASAAVVYLLGSTWRLLEVIVQGVVGGVVLFWRLARWTVRAIWRGVWRMNAAAFATDTWLGQRTHAAYWTYSYWLKRAYIASRLRAWRRENRL